MNGRLQHEDSPEGKLAAIAVILGDKMEDAYQKTGKGPRKPDVADLKDLFRPFIQSLLIKARLDESGRTMDMRLERRAELVRQLYVLEAQIPEAYRL